MAATRRPSRRRRHHALARVPGPEDARPDGRQAHQDQEAGGAAQGGGRAAGGGTGAGGGPLWAGGGGSALGDTRAGGRAAGAGGGPRGVGRSGRHGAWGCGQGERLGAGGSWGQRRDSSRSVEWQAAGELGPLLGRAEAWQHGRHN